MEWNTDKSVKLTKACIYVFMAALLAADAAGPLWMPWYCSLSAMKDSSLPYFCLTLYSASVFGWICLWSLKKLLSAISRGDVFTQSNTAMLRRISWCCAGACFVFLAAVLYYRPFLIVSAAAGFMMLIVRVIKNVFEQAIGMKTELDLTV